MKWFKHMTASWDDEKLARAVGEGGIEGLALYGLYWRLLEIVASQMEGKRPSCSVQYTVTRWSLLLSLRGSLVFSTLSRLAVTGVVTVYRDANDIRVTIPNLLKYRDEYSKKSGHSPDNVRSRTEGEGEGDTETERTSTARAREAPPKPPPPLKPTPPDESLDAIASQQAAAVVRPPEAEWNQAALIEEIAIASPAGVANSWTPLSLHGNNLALSAVVNAVMLEAREQAIPEREAALWLLGRMRQVTEAVMHEPGWKRYWTAKRMVGFYGSTEYRDMEKFTHGGMSNGNGNGTGRRGNTDGNAEVRRRLLGSASGEAVDPQAGDRAGAVEPGGHTGAGPVEAGGGGGVHGGARGPDAGAVHRGVLASVGAKPVLSVPSRTQSLRWPS